jgi:hypothetical protein
MPIGLRTVSSIQQSYGTAAEGKEGIRHVPKSNVYITIVRGRLFKGMSVTLLSKRNLKP